LFLKRWQSLLPVDTVMSCQTELFTHLSACLPIRGAFGGQLFRETAAGWTSSLQRVQRHGLHQLKKVICLSFGTAIISVFLQQ
jgi:hypothetical protein